MPQQLDPNGNGLLPNRPACQGDGYLPGKLCEASATVTYIDAQHRLRKVCIDCYLRRTNWQGCQAEIAIPVFDMQGCMVDRKVLGFCPAPAQSIYDTSEHAKKFLCSIHHSILTACQDAGKKSAKRPKEESA